MTSDTEAQKQTDPAGAIQLDETHLEQARGGVLATQNVALTVAQKVVGASAVKLGDGSVRPIIKAGDGSV